MGDSGVHRWCSGYGAMLRFDVAAQRTWLPMFVAMQLLFGVGMAVIYGFYVGHPAPATARWIVTGAPTLPVLTTGMVQVPAMVGDRKLTGSWDFIWSLPVARSAAVASTFTVYTAMSIPGIVATLFLSAWRFGVTVSPSPMLVPAFLLAGLAATSMGFGLAQAVRDPFVTNLIGNVLIFVVLLFSPVVFPIGQFPGWLADAHRVLPIYPLAEIIRASVTAGMVHGVATDYAVLAAWTAAAWLATALAVGRRR